MWHSLSSLKPAHGPALASLQQHGQEQPQEGNSRPPVLRRPLPAAARSLALSLWRLQAVPVILLSSHFSHRQPQLW